MPTTQAQFAKDFKEALEEAFPNELYPLPFVKDILAIQASVVTDHLVAQTKDKDHEQNAAVTIPGLAKITLVHTDRKPKRKARNPATGEEVWVDPKPAGKKLKATFPKAVKDRLTERMPRKMPVR